MRKTAIAESNYESCPITPAVRPPVLPILIHDSVLQDMRTYVALSNQSVAAAHGATSESQEVWGYWPDDEPVKGLHPGDSRAALTPFLAHEVCIWDFA